MPAISNNASACLCDWRLGIAIAWEYIVAILIGHRIAATALQTVGVPRRSVLHPKFKAKQRP
jgi:hypothetical protein